MRIISKDFGYVKNASSALITSSRMRACRLTTFDTESVENFKPALATEWSISPDGLTYTFKTETV